MHKVYCVFFRWSLYLMGVLWCLQICGWFGVCHTIEQCDAFNGTFAGNKRVLSYDRRRRRQHKNVVLLFSDNCYKSQYLGLEFHNRFRCQCNFSNTKFEPIYSPIYCQRQHFELSIIIIVRQQWKNLMNSFFQSSLFTLYLFLSFI